MVPPFFAFFHFCILFGIIFWREEKEKVVLVCPFLDGRVDEWCVCGRKGETTQVRSTALFPLDIYIRL